MSAALLKTELHTPVCDLLGCEYPIVLAGMGGVSRSELVLAVTRAGGFGFLGMVRESPRLIRTEIEKVRSGTDRDFGVNLIPAATRPDLLEAEISACIAERVPVIALFWDLQPNVLRRFRDSGALVVCQIGDVPEAEAAQAAGAQVLIAQGFEAGGHVRGRTPLRDLLPAVIAATDLPVLAAGGILDGHDLAFALGQGAQGVVIGTAFLATCESFAHEFHKQRIVDALPGSTIHTDAFHVNWPKGAYVRVLENSVTRGEHGDPFSGHRSAIGSEGDRTIWLFSTDSPLRSMSGNLEAMALYAGDAAGRIKAIVPAGERLQSIVNEVQPLLDKAGTDVVESDVEVTSPICYAREASDIYLGYASTEELLEFLNELLEVERAGARIAARIAAESSLASLTTLMHDVRHDEARWCAMLLKWINHLGGTPSRRTGTFYEKSLAITDLQKRAAFINRGQECVLQEIREILPRIRDDRMHADFREMLISHEFNISRANRISALRSQ